MKRTVYLDTTIPNYYFDKRESLKTFSEITRKWWKEERHNFDIYISEETLDELNAGEYPHKKDVIKFVFKLKVLPPDENIIDIAQIYLDNYLMPQFLKGDVIHLAYASYL